MDSDALLSEGQLRHVNRLPINLDDDPFEEFSQEEQIARLKRQCDALVMETQEIQEEIDRNHKKQEKLQDAERTLQEDLARVQDRLTGMKKRVEEIERPSSKRPAYEVDIPPCTAKSSNKKPRLGQGRCSPPAEQDGYQRQDAGNTMTSERPSASSTTAVAIKREPFTTGSLGDKIMTFLGQGKDARVKDDSMAETVDVLVEFEHALSIEALVRRLRDLVNRVPDLPPSRHDTTVESIARMSFDFENVRGLKFTIMCVKAKKISNAKFAEEQEARVDRGERPRKVARKVTWYAEKFAEAEARIEGRTAKLDKLKVKWTRFLRYGSFLIDTTDLIGNEAGLIVFPFEAIYPNRRDVSTLLQYGRSWLSHRVQQEPLRSILSKLGLIIMSATDGKITTEGLSPYSEKTNVSHWKVRVSKMLDHFTDPANHHSVQLDRVVEVSMNDHWGNKINFTLIGDHIMQLDSPTQWLTDDCIQAVILCSTDGCDCTYIPPSVLLSLQSDPKATKPDWEIEKCERFFLVLSTMDGSSDRGGNHFACASVLIDIKAVPKTVEAEIFESYIALDLFDQYKAQISSWLGAQFDITFDLKDVFQQRDSYNCGIHVIAQGISLMNDFTQYDQDLSTEACWALRKEYRNLLQREMLELPNQEVDDPDLVVPQPIAEQDAPISSSRDDSKA